MQYIRQEHTNGCIIACLAMLSGKSYREVVRILYPDIYVPSDDEIMYYRDSYYMPDVVTHDVGQTVTELLGKLGCRARKSKTMDIRRLSQRSRNSILIIRWAGEERYVSHEHPWMCHAVVYDVEQQRILDPGRSSTMNLLRLQQQLDSVYYVDQL